MHYTQPRGTFNTPFCDQTPALQQYNRQYSASSCTGNTLAVFSFNHCRQCSRQYSASSIAGNASGNIQLQALQAMHQAVFGFKHCRQCIRQYSASSIASNCRLTHYKTSLHTNFVLQIIFVPSFFWTSYYCKITVITHTICTSSITMNIDKSFK